MASFDNENREVIIDHYDTPAPWMNYLSNGVFHTMISQAGGGVAFYRSPQIWRINHYRFFHLPTDRSGFYTYIKDGENIWCPTNEPCVNCRPDKWKAVHGMGYTRYEAEKNGLSAHMLYFIGHDENALIWHMVLQSDTDKEITVFPYVELGMMEFMREMQWQCYNKHQLECYRQNDILIYHYGVEMQPKPDETPLVFFACDVPVSGFDCDRDEFVGSYHSEENPQCVERGACRGSELYGGDPVFALEIRLKLKAGVKKELNIFLGTGMSKNEIAKNVEKYRKKEFVSNSFQSLKKNMECFPSKIQLQDSGSKCPEQ